MDKADRDRIKIALTKLDRNPFFVYAPAKKALIGGKPLVLEFLLTAAQREARVQELREKYGEKLVKGRVAETEDSLEFRPVRKPAKEFGIDLKKLGQKIPGLAKATIVDPKDDERDDQLDADAKASAKAARKLNKDAHQQGALDAAADGIKEIPLRDRVKKALVALDAAADRVERYEARVEIPKSATFRGHAKTVFDAFPTLATEADKRAKKAASDEKKAKTALDRANQAAKDASPPNPKLAVKAKEALTAWEKAHGATGEAQGAISLLASGKKELEAAYGGVSALVGKAEPLLVRALGLVQKATALRKSAAKKSEFAAFADHVGQLVETVNQIAPVVRQLDEAMGMWQRRANDLTGLWPDAPVDVTDVEGLDDEDPSGTPKASKVERLHATGSALVASPLTTYVVQRIPVVEAVRAKKLTGKKPERILDTLAQLVLLSKTDAAELTNLLGQVSSVAEAQQLADTLAKEALASSAEIKLHIAACQSWYTDVYAAFGEPAKVRDAFKAANKPDLDLTQVKRIAGFDDVAGHQGFGAVEGDEPGKLGGVSVTESTKVIVVGGGPIGLMAAIEARLKGAIVTLFEGRPDPYSRQNVLKIDPSTAARLSRYGVGEKLGMTKRGTGLEAPPPTPVAVLEDALAERASALGVNVVKGVHVTEVDTDSETGEVLVSLKGRPRPEAARIAIIAVGAGITGANRHAGGVVLAEKLGIKFETFGAKDYAAAGVYKGVGGPNNEALDLDDELAWEVNLVTDGSAYKLTQLSKAEFERVKDDKAELMKLIEGRVKKAGPGANAFPGKKLDNAGRFEIVIQKAEQFVSPKGSAVLVGDSVTTPHPVTGSGTNTGASEVSIVGDLVRDFVLAMRSGGTKKARSTALKDYETEMRQVAEKQGKKGIDAMLEFRRGRVRKSAVAIAKLRKARDAKPQDAMATAELRRFLATDDNAASAELKTFATVDLSQQDGWKIAATRVASLDRVEEDLRGLLKRLEQTPDPRTFETILHNGLAPIQLRD